jgi:hypothetical protein
MAIMMFRIAFLLASATTLLFALLLIAARARDYTPEIAWLAQGCALPCWRGIQPGVTGSDAALARLNAMADVRDVSVTPTGALLNGGTGYVSWRWRGLTHEDIGGVLIIDQGRVREIFLNTPLRMGDLWLSLGHPTGGTVDYLFGISGRVEVIDTAAYPAHGLSATAYVGCPMRLPNLWTSTVYIWLRAADDGRFTYEPYSAYSAKLAQSFRDGGRTYC